MSASISSFWQDRRGAAAAEMALVMPVLLLLMVGAFEMGKYFLDAHTIQKAVRDGARYAGRQPFSEMPCGGAATDDAQIKNLVRTGTTAAGGTARISYWTDPATITVSTTCDPTEAYTASGLYTAVEGGARRVTVDASVPYTGLFGYPLFGATVNGRSEAAVTGG